MVATVCEWCGGSTLTLRAGARFCSTKHRVYANRQAKKGPKLPVEMTSQERFVRYTSRKVPRTVEGRSASSTDPRTWSSYTAASGSHVGFVLGAGIGCVDLDHCIVDGELLAWASDVVAANAGTYIEISRSGEGLHIFGHLAEAPGRLIRDGRSIEIYSTGRYIALTGNTYRNAPALLESLVVPALL